MCYFKSISSVCKSEINPDCPDLDKEEKCVVQCSSSLIECISDCDSDQDCISKCNRSHSFCLNSCPCHQDCYLGCFGCLNSICLDKSVLILSTVKPANTPQLVTFDGQVQNINFNYDYETEVFRSCSVSFKNELYVFGGDYHRDQVACMSHRL